MWLNRFAQVFTALLLFSPSVLADEPLRPILEVEADALLPTRVTEGGQTLERSEFTLRANRCVMEIAFVENGKPASARVQLNQLTAIGAARERLSGRKIQDVVFLKGPIQLSDPSGSTRSVHVFTMAAFPVLVVEAVVEDLTARKQRCESSRP